MRVIDGVKLLNSHTQKILDCNNKIEENTLLLENKLNKNSILTMANLGTDIKEAMSGGSVAVVGINTVEEKNIIDDQVTERKTNFLQSENTNLEIILTYNKIMQDSGSIQDIDSYCMSQYIKIEPSTSYSFNFKSNVIYFDNNKNLISSARAYINAPIATPDNSCYMVLSISKTNLPEDTDNLIVVKGTKSLNKGDIKYYLHNKYIKDESITPAKTSFFYKDRIDFTIYKGKVIQPSGEEQNNESFWDTNFIPVTGKTTYSTNFDAKFFEYNSNKIIIRSSKVLSTSFTTLNDTKYIRFTERNDTSTVEKVLCNGSISRNAEECRTFIPSKYLPSQKSTSLNKIVTFYGDSITQQHMYTNTLSLKMNFKKVYNHGIGGTSIADNSKYSNVEVQDKGLGIYKLSCDSTYVPTNGIVIPSNFCKQERINLIPKDSEIIIIMGGTNDFGQNIPMGTFESKDEKTFCGAMLLMIERIKNTIPNAEIFVCSPPYGINNTGGNVNLSFPSVNSQTKTIIDYGDIIKEACKITSTHYIPVGEDSGIAYYNIEDNLQDGVHPTQTGSNKIAGVMERYLRCFYNL